VPLVAAADPASWWGTRARSFAERPVRPVDEPVTLSASALDALLTCPAKWFLEREAGGQRESSAAQGFGNVVHGLADRVAKGELGEDVTVDDLMQHVDKVWGQLPFRTPWSSAKDREEIRNALAWFLAWHRRPEARRVLATEERIRAEVTVGGERIRLYGFADRLEVDAAGRVVVIDLKTTKQHPSGEAVAEHPQLGLYQLAVANGAVDELVGGPALAGGAELLQLRGPDLRAAKVQRQDPLDEESGERPIELQLTEAVRRIRDEDFPAQEGKHCDFCDFTAMCPAKTSGTVLS
jgi:RecB family exonuclease